VLPRDGHPSANACSKRIVSVSERPFIDRNKRVAVTRTAALVRANGYRLEFEGTLAFVFLVEHGSASTAHAIQRSELNRRESSKPEFWGAKISSLAFPAYPLRIAAALLRPQLSTQAEFFPSRPSSASSPSGKADLSSMAAYQRL